MLFLFTFLAVMLVNPCV